MKEDTRKFQKGQDNPTNSRIEMGPETKAMSPPPFQLLAEDGGEEEGLLDEPSQLKSGPDHADENPESPAEGQGGTEKPNDTGLPDDLKSGVEQLSGTDLSDVKVHYNSSSPSQLKAYAYAQGNEIHLGPGQEKHLPHEAWHVAQQKQGRVQPNTEVRGQAVNNDAGLEQEADTMGAKALQMKSNEDVAPASYEDMFWTNLTGSPDGHGAVQRMEEVPEESDQKESEVTKLTPPESKFSEIPPKAVVADSSENILQIVRPILGEYIVKVNYNSLEDAAGFVDHLAEGRVGKTDLSAEEAYGSYQPDSVTPIKKGVGGQCVGQGVTLAAMLRERALPAFPVAAKFAGRKSYGHGAAMIKFKNPEITEDSGYILMDPGFNLTEPLVITADESPVVRGYIYALNQDGDVESRKAKGGSLMTTFPTKAVENPESISSSALLSYKQFNLVSRREDGRTALTLDLRNKSLAAFIFTGRKKATLFSITFDPEDMESTASLLELNVKQDLAVEMGYEHGALIKTLIKVIGASKDILALQDAGDV